MKTRNSPLLHNICYHFNLLYSTAPFLYYLYPNSRLTLSSRRVLAGSRSRSTSPWTPSRCHETSSIAITIHVGVVWSFVNRFPRTGIICSHSHVPYTVTSPPWTYHHSYKGIKPPRRFHVYSPCNSGISTTAICLFLTSVFIGQQQERCSLFIAKAYMQRAICTAMIVKASRPPNCPKAADADHRVERVVHQEGIKLAVASTTRSHRFSRLYTGPSPLPVCTGHAPARAQRPSINVATICCFAIGNNLRCL